MHPDFIDFSYYPFDNDLLFLYLQPNNFVKKFENFVLESSFLIAVLTYLIYFGANGS